MKDLDFEKLLGIRDVYMKTVMSSNYKKDIFYTKEQVLLEYEIYFKIHFIPIW